MSSILILTLTLTASVYRCEEADGSVVFSQTPCAEDAERLEVSTRVDPETTWSFVNTRDEMTGARFCGVVSPSFYACARQDCARLEIVALGGPGRETVYLRSDEVLHVESGGTGLRVGVFFFNASGASQRALELSNDRRLIEALKKNDEVRARVRLWPWPETVDTDPEIFRGFVNAWERTRACS